MMTDGYSVYPGTNVLHFRSGPRGMSTYLNGVSLGIVTHTESLELGEFLVAADKIDTSWPQLPAGVDGVQIRYKRHIGGTRLAGAEPKVIVTETERWVIYKVWSSTGEYLNEVAQLKAEFEDDFERREI